MTVIVATRADGGEAAFVVAADRLTATELDRLACLIEASPGLADATWTAHEGDSPR